MQDLSIRKAGALPAPAKQALEALLGRTLSDEEEVSVWTSLPHSAPDGEQRSEAWRELNDRLNQLSAKAPQESREQLEKLVDQACDEVRHGPG